METFQRSQVNTLVARLKKPPDRLIFVSGPRHSGKTTIVRQALQSVGRWRDYFDVPNDADLKRHRGWYADTTSSSPPRSDLIWLGKMWRNARARASAHPNGAVLVLDEIQEIPDWSWVVKGLWDSDRYANRQLHVVLVCSAPMRIQSSLTESMAGRFEILRVPHWSFIEMRSAFGYDLEKYLYFGGYPGAAKLIHEEKSWRNFVIHAHEAVIEKDILAMTRVDKPTLFKRLFAMGIRHSGKILPLANTFKLPPQFGDTPKLSSDLDLLANVDLLASFRRYDPQYPWHHETFPKLNVLNTASFTATSEHTFEQARTDVNFWGQLIESAIGAHILNTASGRVRPYYWREKTRGTKQNGWFVLHRGPNVNGIHVERGRERAQLQAKELTAFNKSIKPKRTIFIGEGGIPLSEFMATPVDRWVDG